MKRYLTTLALVLTFGIVTSARAEGPATQAAPGGATQPAPGGSVNQAVCGYFASLLNSCLEKDPLVLQHMEEQGIASCSYFMAVLQIQGCGQVKKYSFWEQLDGVLYQIWNPTSLEPALK